MRPDDRQTIYSTWKELNNRLCSARTDTDIAYWKSRIDTFMFVYRKDILEEVATRTDHFKPVW